MASTLSVWIQLVAAVRKRQDEARPRLILDEGNMRDWHAERPFDVIITPVLPYVISAPWTIHSLHSAVRTPTLYREGVVLLT